MNQVDFKTLVQSYFDQRKKEIQTFRDLTIGPSACKIKKIDIDQLADE